MVLMQGNIVTTELMTINVVTCSTSIMMFYLSFKQHDENLVNLVKKNKIE